MGTLTSSLCQLCLRESDLSYHKLELLQKNSIEFFLMLHLGLGLSSSQTPSDTWLVYHQEIIWVVR